MLCKVTVEDPLKKKVASNSRRRAQGGENVGVKGVNLVETQNL